jgi:predicted O-methyltransferase YrrM
VTLDARLSEYIRERFAPEDDVLEGVRAAHEARGLPEIFISPEEAQIIVVLLRTVGARRVLEVGTLGGYSGIWMARALPAGGRLVTIEHHTAHARVAAEAFAAAGVDDRVEMHQGEALAVMKALDPPFDAVFLDADKAPLPQYFEEAARLVRTGGLILCDNTLLDGRVIDPKDQAADVLGVRTYNDRAATDERFVSALIPVRDGLTVSLKVGS